MRIHNKVQTKFGVEHFRDMLSIEVVSLTGALLAGMALAAYKNAFEVLPALLILIPGFLEMRGSISGSLAARLTSGLFLHALKPEVKKTSLLRGNIVASFILTAIVSTVLGLAAYFLSSYIFGSANFSIVYIALLAGLLSSAIEIPITIFATFWIFRHGHDPNAIIGPYITTMGDLTSVASLLIIIALVL